MSTRFILSLAISTVILYGCDSSGVPEILPDPEIPVDEFTDEEKRVIALKRKYFDKINDIEDYTFIIEEAKNVNEYRLVAANNEEKFSLFYMDENGNVAYSITDTLVSGDNLSVKSISDPGTLRDLDGAAVYMHRNDSFDPEYIRFFYLSDTQGLVHLLDYAGKRLYEWGGYEMNFSNGFMHYEKNGNLNFHRIQNGELLQIYSDRISWGLTNPYIIYNDAKEVCFLEPYLRGYFKITCANIALNNGREQVNWVKNNSIYLPTGELEAGESYDRSFELEINNGFLEINVEMTISKFDDNGVLIDTVSNHSYKFDMDSGDLVSR